MVLTVVTVTLVHMILVLVVLWYHATCFIFQAVLREKLKYAIHFCKSIDTDEYARVAMPGSGGASSNCDSDELDSIASDGAGSV